ncbi:hypothetical protein Q5M85_14715 [Paraclostridium bifermentans]|nr:hypothetical protein [Paraclostridium bifermentans]
MDGTLSINEQTTGSPQELIDKGVVSFMASAYKLDATINNVYDDFSYLEKYLE